MKASIKFFSLAIIAGFILSACAPSAPQLEKVMEEHPEILYKAIQKDPAKFFQVIREAQQKAQSADEEKFAQEEQKKREEEYANPKTPEITPDRAFSGSKDAPITIVEYSDFQCPFCQRGHNTMKEVLKAYEGKVKIVFKNFPIERIHPLARPASEMYEAIRLQDASKALKFKDIVFENQDELNKGGQKFIEEAAKKAGANVAKAKTDAKGEEVKKVLDADRTEAEKYGFSGTPGYLVNGVSLKGAYPFEDFKEVIEKHLAKK